MRNASSTSSCTRGRGRSATSVRSARVEVEAIVGVLLGDDRAHVGEQRARQRLRFLDVAMRGALGAHERRFEVERERGEVMAERVVQLAGDAKAFGEPAAVGDEILHRAKLRARPQLAVEKLEREERQDLKSEIRRREQKRRAAVPVNRDGAGEEQRLARRSTNSPRRRSSSDGRRMAIITSSAPSNPSQSSSTMTTTQSASIASNERRGCLRSAMKSAPKRTYATAQRSITPGVFAPWMTTGKPTISHAVRPAMPRMRVCGIARGCHSGGGA